MVGGKHVYWSRAALALAIAATLWLAFRGDRSADSTESPVSESPVSESPVKVELAVVQRALDRVVELLDKAAAAKGVAMPPPNPVSLAWDPPPWPEIRRRAQVVLGRVCWRDPAQLTSIGDESDVDRLAEVDPETRLDLTLYPKTLGKSFLASLVQLLLDEDDSRLLHVVGTQSLEEVFEELFDTAPPDTSLRTVIVQALSDWTQRNMLKVPAEEELSKTVHDEFPVFLSCVLLHELGHTVSEGEQGVFGRPIPGDYKFQYGTGGAQEDDVRADAVSLGHWLLHYQTALMAYEWRRSRGRPGEALFAYLVMATLTSDEQSAPPAAGLSFLDWRTQGHWKLRFDDDWDAWLKGEEQQLSDDRGRSIQYKEGRDLLAGRQYIEGKPQLDDLLDQPTFEMMGKDCKCDPKHDDCLHWAEATWAYVLNPRYHAARRTGLRSWGIRYRHGDMANEWEWGAKNLIPDPVDPAVKRRGNLVITRQELGW